MSLARPVSIALAAGLLAGLGGCASLPRFAHWVKVKPVHVGSDRQVAAQDGFYDGAAAAIGRRDYGRALELLQAARARKPDDVRVINAFGVVYDKLGRFDLSSRYYAQARALEPGSQIVVANEAYSETLRLGSQAIVLAAGVPQTRLVEAATPGVIRLGFVAPTPQTLPLLAGGPLRIADASGRKDGAEPARQELARLGWTAPKSRVRTVAPEPRSTIVYAPGGAHAAHALARTLPRGVRLIACEDDCQGVRLTLGADSLGWKLTARTAGSVRGD